MPQTLTEAELTLLRYLHEHSGVSGGRIGLDPKAIKRELRITTDRLNEDSTALAARGFAGVRHTRLRDDEVASTTCAAIWLTSKGEDYLRRSDSGRGANRTSLQ